MDYSQPHMKYTKLAFLSPFYKGKIRSSVGVVNISKASELLITEAELLVLSFWQPMEHSILGIRHPLWREKWKVKGIANTYIPGREDSSMCPISRKWTELRYFFYPKYPCYFTFDICAQNPTLLSKWHELNFNKSLLPHL